jgi:molybdate transport system ATP-binding protein
VSLLEFSCRLGYPSGFMLDAVFSTDAPVTALFGPSASGKTSILSIIAGLRRPDSGRICLGDRVVFDSAKGINLPPEARHVSYVFQDHLLFPHLDVRHNLLFGWKRRSSSAQPIDWQRVIEVLELQDTLERLPHTLSGGQRQRVALGRALLCGPGLLLFDEPVASLDAALKDRILDYLGQVLAQWRIPTLYVTHNPAELKRLARWAIALEHGKVRAEGPPEALFNELVADGLAGADRTRE